MEITEVKVFPIQEEKLKAFVSVVFDHCFMVNDIKIIQGRDGLFISMPSRKKKNGEFKDVAHPLNNETRRMIEDKVLVEYERALEGRGEPVPAMPHVHAPREVPTVVAAAMASSAGAAAHGIAVVPVPMPVPAALVAGTASAAAAGDGAGSVPQAASGAPPAAVGTAAEKTLEEIEEMHLRDSFWTVT
jgi:stage V sporulation protein G